MEFVGTTVESLSVSKFWKASLQPVCTSENSLQLLHLLIMFYNIFNCIILLYLTDGRKNDFV